MKAYKGFNKDMTCRGFQFEQGKTYEEEKASLCHSGFHACEDPLECFGYYAPRESVYHEVELDEVCDERHSDDSKVCAKKITVGARLNLSQLVQAAFDFRFSRAKIVEGGHSTGNWGAASATGEMGAASATGEMGAASATGEMGAASATGYMGAASATGNWGAASATGYMGAASATGNWGAASATGKMGAASATGEMGAASATGERGAASATGEMGAASATGNWGAASATGNWGAASATGYMGAASATGYMGAASATGNWGVAVALGIEGIVKGALGCWLVAAEWSRDTNKREWHRKDVQSVIVDGEKIKADTWYTLKNGEFVEV